MLENGRPTKGGEEKKKGEMEMESAKSCMKELDEKPNHLGKEVLPFLENLKKKVETDKLLN